MYEREPVDINKLYGKDMLRDAKDAKLVFIHGEGSTEEQMK